MDLKKADEEMAKGVAVRDIIADHRAIRASLRILWYVMATLCAISLICDWSPGSTGGSLGLAITSVTEFVYARRKIK